MTNINTLPTASKIIHINSFLWVKFISLNTETKLSNPITCLGFEKVASQEFILEDPGRVILLCSLK